MSKNKSQTLELRLDWSELDYYKHINNVSFFKYLQSARVNFWEELGINKIHTEQNIGPMLASSKCDFKRPLFFPGEISIESHVVFIKNSSFSFRHNILNEKGEVVAIGEDVMVLYDFSKNKSHNLSEEIRNNLNAYLVT